MKSPAATKESTFLKIPGNFIFFFYFASYRAAKAEKLGDFYDRVLAYLNL